MKNGKQKALQPLRGIHFIALAGRQFDHISEITYVMWLAMI